MKLPELEALAEKATGGTWIADYDSQPDGHALAWLGNWYVDTDAPKIKGSRYQSPECDAQLIAYLANHRHEIIALAKAAKPFAQEYVIGLESGELHYWPESEIARCKAVYEALAAFEDKS